LSCSPSARSSSSRRASSAPCGAAAEAAEARHHSYETVTRNDQRSL
jgi:hypothetical protein